MGLRLLLPAAVLLAALIPYLLTLAPTISWRNGGIDSGELVTAVYTLGIPHPTGFPVYVLLGRLFILLPFGDVAYRVNLMSATAAASAVALLAIIASRLLSCSSPSSEARREREPAGADSRSLRKPIPPSPAPAGEGGQGGEGIWPAAAGAALTFAFSPLFWSRATIAKEYALQICLLALALALLIEWRATGRSAYLTGFGLALGLGLGVHVTVLSILPGALAFIALADRRLLRQPAPLALTGLAILGGALSYAYLPLRAGQQPVLNWGDPATVARLLAHLTGAQYQNMLFRLGPLEVGERFLYAIQSIPRELGWLAFICLLVGVWAVARRDRPFTVLAGIVAGLNVFFAANYPVRDSEVYLLPAYFIGALFVAAGLQEAVIELSAWLQARRPAGIALGVPSVAITLAILLPAVSLVANFGRVDASDDYTARDYALAVLDAADRNAVVVADRDEVTFPLWYAQEVLGHRPDIVVVDSRLVGWDWYREHLARRYLELGLQGPHPEAAQRLLGGNVSGRPVFNVVPPDLTGNRIPSQPVRRVSS